MFNFKTVSLKNDTFDVIESIKYLENILKYNLDDILDVSQNLNTFFKSFYSVFRCFCKLYLNSAKNIVSPSEPVSKIHVNNDKID